MTQEEKDFLKATFGYEYKDLRKKITYKLKPYKNWNGVDEPEMGMEQPNGQDESLYNFKVPLEMMWHKDCEMFIRY